MTSFIHIIGKDGQLGKALLETCPTEYKTLVIPYSKKEWDITSSDYSSLKEHLFTPTSVIINCAAFTDVDAAEVRVSSALAINAEGPRKVAAFASERGMRSIHFSTEYVFPGYDSPGKGRPYKTYDRRGAINMYGSTKGLGETEFLRFGGSVIIRTSWLFSGLFDAESTCFVNSIRKQVPEPINVVKDQWGRPTYAPDLARAVWENLYDIKTGSIKGIIHAGNKGIASRAEVAREVYHLLGEDPAKINEVTSDQYPTLAKRPKFAVLELDWELPDWRDGLRRSIKGIL